MSIPPTLSGVEGLRARAERRGAFSLVEVMIVMGLLSVIVVGLMMMFNQTQRAFRLGLAQTDVLEAGRMSTEMIVRELEQMAPSHLPTTNINTYNFYASVIPPGLPPKTYEPFIQPLAEGFSRTNVLQDMFFVTRENQTWTGIGYFVRTEPRFGGEWGPVGSLYRFELAEHRMQFENPSVSQAMLQSYWNSATNVSRVLDGVVHFRVRIYDTNGIWMNPGPGIITYPNRTEWSTLAPGEVNCVFGNLLSPQRTEPAGFRSNAVPAFVEFELGILEQQTYERYLGIPVPEAQAAFLEKQAGKVHLFRQRVSIRNVDPSAYNED